MRKTVNTIVRITIVFMIIAATINVVGGILLARGGKFPPTSALFSWALDGAGIGVAVGAVVGILVALVLKAFNKYLRRSQGSMD
jgi:hypothetical protein